MHYFKTSYPIQCGRNYFDPYFASEEAKVSRLQSGNLGSKLGLSQYWAYEVNSQTVLISFFCIHESHNNLIRYRVTNTKTETQKC